jgi:hypothetical protein
MEDIFFSKKIIVLSVVKKFRAKVSHKIPQLITRM